MLYIALFIFGCSGVNAANTLNPNQDSVSESTSRVKWFEQLSNNKDFVLSTLSTGQNFRRGDDVFKLLKNDLTVNLQASRGESEGFQIIVSSNKEASNLNITFSGLADSNGRSFPSSAIKYGEVLSIGATESILGETPEEKAYYLGSWPDLIVDEQPATLNVAPQSESVLYLRFSVPLDTPEGVYSGEITLGNASGKESIKINLEVLDFTLPEHNSLPIVFCFFPQFYRDWNNIEQLNAEQTEYLYNFLKSYRIPPTNIYDENLYPSVADMKQYDLPLATSGYFNFYHNLSTQEIDNLIAKFTPRLQEVEKAQLQDRVYFYAYDELSLQGGSDLKNAAKQVVNSFKSKFPWLKRVQTSAPEADLLEAFDIWCPLFDYAANDNQEFLNYQKSGIKMWWYAADYPANPCPNFFLGYPGTAPRAIMSLTWQKKMDGILYWCINREWPTNVKNKNEFYQDSQVWIPAIIPLGSPDELIRRNGMGNLVYPGPDGKIYASLRLENLRDGIEDYEYYVLLSQKIEALRKIAPTSPLLPAAEKLLQLPSDVATDITQYNHDPQPMINQHKSLGKMIVQIDKEINANK